MNSRREIGEALAWLLVGVVSLITTCGMRAEAQDGGAMPPGDAQTHSARIDGGTQGADLTGLVVEGSAVVTTADAGVHLMPSAVCLDETAAVRVARELASRRAVEPVLREAPVATPFALVVVAVVGVALGTVGGVYVGVRVCAETSLCVTPR